MNKSKEKSSSVKNVSAKNVENLSRREILSWVNETLDSNFKRIEELCCGSPYCQLLDMIFPGSIYPLVKKVKFQTVVDKDYLHNWKVLEDAFTKLEIKKAIDMDKLIRGRFQDNLEFVQWFKKFYDVNYKENDHFYNPREARDCLPFGPEDNSGQDKQDEPRAIPGNKTKEDPSRKINQNSNEKTPTKLRLRNNGPKMRKPQLPKPKVENSEIDIYTSLLADTKLSLEGVEKERDFYFGKLRRMEIYCQELEKEASEMNPTCQKILDILYATQEGFTAAESKPLDPFSIDGPDLDEL